MNKTDVAVTCPLVILDICTALEDFLKTWQIPPSDVAVLTDDGESFVVLCEHNALDFRCFDPDRLNLLESISVENIHIRTLNYKKVLSTSAVLQQINLTQLNLTCLFQIVIKDMVNQNFVDESDRKLVARWVDCYCRKGFCLSPNRCIFYDVVFSCEFANASQVIP